MTTHEPPSGGVCALRAWGFGLCLWFRPYGSISSWSASGFRDSAHAALGVSGSGLWASESLWPRGLLRGAPDVLGV